MKDFTTDIISISETISKGAEATISRGRILSTKAIFKERTKKKYRIGPLDDKLRKERTVQEIRILKLAQENNIPVPKLLDFDKSNWTIVMEEIDGNPVKELFITSLDLIYVFQGIGKYVARLHNLNIIHGDLTTSNILVKNKESIYFIDFGLGYISTNIEDFAVDILVLKHTLESSHANHASVCFQAFLDAYMKVCNHGKQVLSRMETVENRVRYRSHELT